MRARAEYVRRLVESLERRHLDLSGTAFAGVNEATLRALRTALHGEPATVLHALTLVQQHAQTVDFEPELRALLQHQDPRIRAAALDQLGEQKKSEALPEMRELLRDPTPEVRAAALGAVCALEQEAAVQTVLPFLEGQKAPEAGTSNGGAGWPWCCSGSAPAKPRTRCSPCSPPARRRCAKRRRARWRV